MNKSLLANLFTGGNVKRDKHFWPRLAVVCCFTAIFLLTASSTHAQIIVENFEELGVGVTSTLSTGVTATTSNAPVGTVTSVAVSAGTRIQNIAATAASSTIDVYNIETSLTKITNATGGRNGTRTSYYSYFNVSTTTATTTSVTDGPDTTGNLTWYYGGGSGGAMNISTNTTGFHSGNHFLAMPSGSFIVTPVVKGGIAAITFWAANNGTTQDNIFIGFRTKTSCMMPTFYSSNTNTANSGGLYSLFNALTSSTSLSNGSKFTTYIMSSSYSTRKNLSSGGIKTGSESAGTIALHYSQYSFAVGGLTGTDAQVVIANWGGPIDIDDIEVFGHIGITLAANPTVCYSASSQTAVLNYTATQANPTTYSISGWSSVANDQNDNFTTPTNVPLSPADTIAIQVPAGAAPGTYFASLTVTDGTSTSTPTKISVTVAGMPGVPAIPSTAIDYYKLDNGTTDTVTTGTRAGNGTAQGAPSYTMDRFGNTAAAISLNGSSQYVSTAGSPAVLTMGTTFSESIWFNTTSTTGVLMGFGKNQTTTNTANNYDRLLYLLGGRVVFGINRDGSGGIDTVGSAGTYNDGNWHMATGVVSNTAKSTTLYIDGVVVATLSGANADRYSSTPGPGYWRLGRQNVYGTGTDTYFNGYLDDAVISTSAFVASDVTAMYGAALPSNNGPICIGNTLNLYESLTAPAPGLSYSWQGPASNGFSSPTENASIPSVAQTDIGTYTVTITNALGCTLTGTTTPSTSTELTPRTSTIPAGLSSYYSFTAAGTSQLDSITATANNGTFQKSGSNPVATTDRYGGASGYTFASSSKNYMSTVTNMFTGGHLPVNFTISAWFNTNSATTTEMPIIGMGNATTTANNTGVQDRNISITNGIVSFYVNPTGTLVNSISSPVGTLYNDGNWHMATATLSSTNGTSLYIDGVLVASNAAYKTAYGYSAAGAYWRVGNNTRTSGGQGYFDGSLDDIAIYNTTVLTANQVSQLYTGTTSNNPANSVCAGTDFTVTEANVTGATTYTWTSPGGAVTTGQTLTVTDPTNQNDSGTYSLLITPAPTGYCPATASITIDVNGPGLTLASYMGSDAQSVCTVGTPLDNIVYAPTGTTTSTSIAWISATPTGVTYTPTTYTISNTPPTASGTYEYKLTASDGACTSVSDTGYMYIAIGSTWTGNSTTAFSDPGSWSCGTPTATSNILIPLVDNEPILDANVTMNNLEIEPGATIGINDKILTVNGAVSGTGVITGSPASGLIMGASSTGTLYFDSTSAATETLDSLQIVDGAHTIKLGDTLNIASTGLLRVGTIGGTGATFAAGINLLTFLSDASGSARLAAVPNGVGSSSSVISGNVNVQCFIPLKRTWCLLTAPVTNNGASPASTIYSAWQNGGVYTPGVGTMITGPGGANGLDAGINGNYSAYTWNSTPTTGLVPVTNTNLGISNSSGKADNIGYFIFVRGDRNPYTVGDPAYAVKNQTTLSASGVLQLGTQPFSFAAFANNAVALVGNPYPSPVDFSILAGDNPVNSISYLSNLNNRFYIWNSNLAGSQGLGNYTCMDGTGQTAGSGIYMNNTTGIASSTDPNIHIQSGQAFFVEATAGTSPGGGVASSITFTEIAKSTTSNFIYRPDAEEGATASPIESFSGTLSLLNSDSSTTLTDGIVAQFKNDFSDSVDDLDAPKFTSFDEMLSLSRSGKNLCIERRATVNNSDTLFLSFTQEQQRAYQFKFTGGMQNHPGLGAHLEDSYTHVHTPLSLTGSSTVNFNIDANAGSEVANRFMVVFGAVNITPAYANISTHTIGNTAVIDWTLSNDQSMSGYALQRSTDGGVTYTTVYTVTANHTTGTYSYIDTDPVIGKNYYRVLNTDVLGEETYSTVVLAEFDSLDPAGITIFPNPVEDGQLHLSMNYMPAGEYHYRVVTILGHEVQNGSFSFAGGNGTNDKILLNAGLAKGTYRVMIVHPDQTVTTIDVISLPE
jgi:Concanavalin A-like lectin/glucanases superfamily